MPRVLPLKLALILAGALAAAGCHAPAGSDPNVPDDELPFGGGSAPEAAGAPPCPPVVPNSCASVPSYSTVVEPLFSRSCVPMCHQPGGTASDRDLTTYAHVAGLGFTVLTPVNTCLMPPPDAGPDAALTVAERAALVQWIACGSPDN
jgi:hypothetical protein